MKLYALVFLLAQTFFTTPLAKADMTDKQAVIETSAGTIVIALLPEAAPNHVGLFMKIAREGGYDGTTFHRVIKYGLIQGGDPLSRDPAKSAQYGQGGLDLLKAEPNAEKHTAGAVSAVLRPGNRNSAGAQFFICISDQPALDGGYDVFGRVVEGEEVAQQISAVTADANGRPAAPITIKSVVIRDTPEDPFLNATVGVLAATKVSMETTKGTIVLDMLPDLAPETVKQFLRLVTAGVYDGTLFHRVVPGFIIQGGALNYRNMPMTAAQSRLVHNLQPEFTNTPNVAGMVSMARDMSDPATGSTSFFICVGTCRQLDAKFTVFAKVSAGMDVAKLIEGVPVKGEAPIELVTVRKMTVKKP